MLMLGGLFFWSKKEEAAARLGVPSILKLMQTLPPQLVFRNPSAYHLLRRFSE